MPHWTEQLIEPPWSKDHIVSLRDPEFYDAAAARGGSNRIRRHEPLSRAIGEERQAGTSGKHHDSADQHLHEVAQQEANEKASRGPAEQEGWEQALRDGSRVISVRDVKDAVPDYKLIHPKTHAFARYVLPLSSDAFAKQDWPGKNDGEKHEEAKPENAQPKQFRPEMSQEGQRFYSKLIEEMELQRSFENNVGRPDGELKALDATALQQLESRLSIDDQSTPDSWIPRSERLIRLAGTHPLNGEPDSSELFDVGLITPTKLHYVRSHGPVPQLNWETHKLAVFSDPPHLIADPKNWTMDELCDENTFKIVELPITFACDGNRRKEMSMTKQASGVSFSTSGVSTSLWRGVFVRDVLLASGLLDQPDQERWYLNFEGADNCSEGYYATSIPLIHAMDQTNDVMLAFGMNGRVLHPDHGYPLRVIIPGYVGGRHVKWVHKLWISKEPNNSHYHIWDNRVIPGFITTREHPLAATFYHHENTACMNQILQSVICKPEHNERIPLVDPEATYKIEGFAYNGGGIAVNRVELTLDGGETWKYCFKHYVNKPLRHGEKHWAWIFWSCEIAIGELAAATEVCVRATDANFQVQPEKISWYHDGQNGNEAWLIIENKVYDVTSVLSWHPGGAAAILGYAGKATVDTTLQYKQIHDNYANSKRDECLIGNLSGEAIQEMEKDALRAAEALQKVKEARKGLTLQPDSFVRATLVKKKVLSKDTRTYQFKLPDNEDGSQGSFRLDIGKHVMLSVHFDNQAVLRSYTPVAPILPSEEDGTFTLCIKTYFPTEGGPYPPGGLISNYLDCMKEGEEIDVRGPVGEIWYKGHGDFEIDGNDYHFSKINLIAGGTGITPHWQLIHAILSDESDHTRISIIDCNKSFDDILLRDRLEKYADEHPDRFKLWHVLSKAPVKKGWKYGEGHLDEELMREHLYAPSDDGEDVVTLLCGPPGLIEKGALPALGKIGFEQGKNVFGF
ncbi:hypothetical protein BDW22DRAFT_1334308 [Trametopsis cervina]|nr:hypothetical protein BDW22DRAFT_1334308 [Trametopsis cervina]